jgi:hypothetical protein
MSLSGGYDSRAFRSDSSEKALTILGNVFLLVAFEIGEVHCVRWQRAHPADPRAESVDEARAFERLAHKVGDARSPVCRLVLPFAHRERGDIPFPYWLLHNHSMLAADRIRRNYRPMTPALENADCARILQVSSLEVRRG